MSEQPKATGAGRGVLYIAFAKFYFLFVGMTVQFTLPRFLSAEQFGRYGLVNYLTSWFNNVAGMPMDTPARWIWSSNNDLHDLVFVRVSFNAP